MRMKAEKTKCPHCGKTVRAGNFCTACGRKLVETCECWVFDYIPYNCGQDKCPGEVLWYEKFKAGAASCQ